jgi:hypothetical protein
MKNLDYALTAIIAAIMILLVVVSGCTTQNQDQGTPRDPRTPYNQYNRFNPQQNRTRDNRMNLSDPERSEMMRSRMENITKACIGKKEGDSCMVTDSRTNASGSCANMQDNLVCNIRPGNMTRPMSR